MATLREQKLAARERLHRENSVEAYYCHGDSDPVPVTVRVHRKQKDVGDANLGFAVQSELVTTIRFLRSELSGAPAQGAYVSISATEAYALGAADPVYGISQDVEASPVSPAKLATLDLPVPE